MYFRIWWWDGVLWVLKKTLSFKPTRVVRSDTMWTAFACRSWKEMARYWQGADTGMKRYLDARAQWVLGSMDKLFQLVGDLGMGLKIWPIAGGHLQILNCKVTLVCLNQTSIRMESWKQDYRVQNLIVKLRMFSLNFIWWSFPLTGV